VDYESVLAIYYVNDVVANGISTLVSLPATSY
jgi:hypothetical protein